MVPGQTFQKSTEAHPTHRELSFWEGDRQSREFRLVEPEIIISGTKSGLLTIEREPAITGDEERAGLNL